MSIKSFENRNKKRDRKIDKRKNGMRVDNAAKKLAAIIAAKAQEQSNGTVSEGN